MPRDERGRLTTSPFDCRVTADGRVLVYREGRQVTVIAGRAAVRLISVLATADHDLRRHLLARATGNYRRGNERRRA